MKRVLIVLGIMMVVGTGLSRSAKAQSLTTIYTFCTATNDNGYCVDGTFPNAITEVSPGLFFGATGGGGVSNGGTAYLLTSEGTFTTIYQFNQQSGTPPNGCFQSINGSLQAVQANDGSYFGITDSGGSGGSGTVFRITTEGTLTTAYQFSGSDGSDPRNLIKGSDGNYYGSTTAGGLNGSGTVFRLTSAGTLTTIHNFAGPDGSMPEINIQSTFDNQFYGVTERGGTNNNGGTIFKMTSAGTLTTLHSFNQATEGVYPLLTLENGNNFYGTLVFGGSNASGTVFQITSTGVFTNLYEFSGPDGSEPLVTYLGSDGTLYGVTVSGGANDGGTAFKLTSAGTLTTLYSFCSDPGCSDGTGPGQLLLGSDGKFYGVSGGGFTNLNGNGTVFILDAGVIVGSCTYSLNPTNAAFTSVGGTGSFNVISTNLCPWAATNNVNFITITSGSTGTGTGTVHYTVAPNVSDSSLTGTITAAGETFTVTQSGGSGCSFKLSATNITMVAKGGSKSVSVKPSSTTCTWTAESNDPFITITSGASITGNGKVVFSVPGNTNTTALSGTMTIAGETFTVDQLAGGCTYKLSPKVGKVKSTGGTETIKVTPSLTDCDWTAVSNDGFITITTGSSGTGKGAVTYTVPNNATSNILTGSITVAGDTFTVIQAGVKQ